MNITTLLHNMRDAIHDNSALNTWATTNYGRNPKVYVGIDTRKPPAADQYPLVHLFPQQKTIGDGNQTHVIGVTCGIYDDDTLTTSKTNVVELEGISYLEDFRKLVETALLTTALSDAHWIASIDVVYETVEYFPYFLCAMDVHIQAELSFGQDFYQ